MENNEINNISFAKQVKEELTLIELNQKERISLLSSFIKSNGTLSISNNEERIVIKIENAKIAKYIYKLLKDEFNDISLSFAYRKNMRFNKSYEFLINILDHIDDVFDKLYLSFFDNKINNNLINSEDKIRGYATGLFLVSGSVSNPVSSNYHFEVYVKDEEYSINVLSMLKKIKVYPFEFKNIKRRNNYVLYLKKSDQIGSFLAYMGANDSALLYEDYRIERDMKNYSNRQANLDYYNYNKSIKNSDELIELINLIDKKLGIKNISNPKLKELCIIRKENPEASYSDLAAILSKKLGKEVSKSNVNHLIRKLREMGNSFRG